MAATNFWYGLGTGFMPTSSTMVTNAMNATGTGGGVVMFAPKTGNITDVCFPITATSGSPGTARCGIQGVSGRAADGTYLAAGSAYVDISSWATGVAWRTLGTAAAVTVGDQICPSLVDLSGTWDAGNRITLGIGVRCLNTAHGQPYGIQYVGSSWSVADVNSFPAWGVKYDDGTVYACGAPCTITNNATWNTGSSPLIIGNRFTVTADSRLVGAHYCIRCGDTVDWVCELYADNASSPTASVTIDWSEDSQYSASPVSMYVPFNGLTLSTGVVYRIVLKPTTVNNPNTFVQMDFVDATARRAFSGEMYGTTADTAGSWTDTTTRLYPIAPVIDQVDVAGSGGGSFVING